MLRAAKFHNSSLAKTDSAAPRCGHLHWNSNGFCLRKESRQLLCAVLLVRCECQAVGFSHVASCPTGLESPALSWRDTLLTARDEDFRRQRCTLDAKGLERCSYCKLQKW